MALQFKLIERQVRLGKNAGKKLFYAQQVATRRISFARLCNELADGSTVDSADVKAVFDRMVKVIRLHIADGEAVDCGELGIFRPTFGSVGVEKAEKFVAQRDIRKPRISFLPRQEFKYLGAVRFQQVDSQGAPVPVPPSNVPSPGGSGSSSGEDSGEGI